MAISFPVLCSVKKIPCSVAQAVAVARSRRGVLAAASRFVCCFQFFLRKAADRAYCQKRASRKPRGFVATVQIVEIPNGTLISVEI
jgi:hypothetical protein